MVSRAFQVQAQSGMVHVSHTPTRHPTQLAPSWLDLAALLHSLLIISSGCSFPCMSADHTHAHTPSHDVNHPEPIVTPPQLGLRGTLASTYTSPQHTQDHSADVAGGAHLGRRAPSDSGATYRAWVEGPIIRSRIRIDLSFQVNPHHYHSKCDYIGGGYSGRPRSPMIPGVRGCLG
jgi:hypothetical protein